MIPTGVLLADRSFTREDVKGFNLVVVTKCWKYVEILSAMAPYKLYQMVQTMADGLLGSALNVLFSGL